MPSKDNKEKSKVNIYSTIDYSILFTSNEFAGIKLETVLLGNVYLPTGKIIACDPLVFIEYAKPLNKIVKPGAYPVIACVANTKYSGKRYAAVEVQLSDQRPEKWEMALAEDQNVDELENPGDYFGYPVDAGLGCFCDVHSQKLFCHFANDFEKSKEYCNIYDNLLHDEFRKNALNPEDPHDRGSWLNFRIPGLGENNIVMFETGYGDGYYPCYWGIDNSNEICRLIVDFKVFDED